MLGGGVFVTQNKTLPGSYINFVSTATTSSTIGERGTVAIALTLNKAPGTVIELDRLDLVENCEELLGVKYNSDTVAPLREIFCHANKVYVYDLGEDKTVADATSAFEAYEFNILCAYTNDTSDISAYITTTKSWRDEMGKKCQVVVYNADGADHEGVINVVSTVSDEGADTHALVAWTAGAEAGCKVNESCTNMLYDGEYSIDLNLTVNEKKGQAALEECIKNGKIAFHLVYGDIRLLEDINSLTTESADKGEDFKYNQTIRVVDQIANDIAKLFNTKYLGKIPNNDSGRASFWGDVVKHHRELEAIEAIEYFDSSLLTVKQGDTKKSIIVNDSVKVINSMSQLYMTVVIQ